jgi:hypothetical protein
MKGSSTMSPWLTLDYYNKARTHLSLNEDAPVPRAIQAVGRLYANPILGGLHHHYGFDFP